MVFYDGYDISSDGPGSFEIYNENDCAAKCIETIGCKGFTMVGLEPYRGCHLKSSFGFKHNMLYNNKWFQIDEKSLNFEDTVSEIYITVLLRL